MFLSLLPLNMNIWLLNFLLYYFSELWYPIPVKSIQLQIYPWSGSEQNRLSNQRGAIRIAGEELHIRPLQFETS